MKIDFCKCSFEYKGKPRCIYNIVKIGKDLYQIRGLACAECEKPLDKIRLKMLKE